MGVCFSWLAQRTQYLVRPNLQKDCIVGTGIIFNAKSKFIQIILACKNVIERLVTHPCDHNRPLFLIFDFVHIIKCIRNNWLNLHAAQCCFIFPSFVDTTIYFNLPPAVSRACFEDFRNQYRLEHSSTLKQEYKLTAQVCWPTNLEVKC